MIEVLKGGKVVAQLRDIQTIVECKDAQLRTLLEEMAENTPVNLGPPPGDDPEFEGKIVERVEAEGRGPWERILGLHGFDVEER